MASTASGRGGVVQLRLRSRHWFQQVSSVARRRGGAASQLAISNVARVGLFMLTHSSPSPAPSPQEPARWSGSGSIETNGDDDDIERGAEGHLHPGSQAHDGRDTSFYYYFLLQCDGPRRRTREQTGRQEPAGRALPATCKESTSRRPRTSAISMPEERDPKQRRSLWLLISDGMGVPLQKIKRRAHEFRREPRPRLWNILNRDPSCNLPAMGSSQSFPCVDEEDRGLTKGAA